MKLPGLGYLSKPDSQQVRSVHMRELVLERLEQIADQILFSYLLRKRDRSLKKAVINEVCGMFLTIKRKHTSFPCGHWRTVEDSLE